MLIHRIAHPFVKCADAGTPCGPYNAYSAAASQEMDDDLVDDLRRVADFLFSNLDSSHTPTPIVEGHYMHAGREQSVFSNVEQAQEWFRAGVEVMREAGFRWLTYEVKEQDVRVLRSQAVALLQRARLVSIGDIPFESDPNYSYCGWCGYNCTCSEDEYGAESDPLMCDGCYEQMWSCLC